MNEAKQENFIVPAEIQNLFIIDTETLETAQSWRKKIKEYIKKVNDHHNPIITKQKEALQAAKDAKEKLLKPANKLDTDLKAQILQYNRLLKEQLEREREIARKAEEERLKQERLEAEKAEKEKIEKRAQQMKDAGDLIGAEEEQKKTEQITVPDLPVMTNVPQEMPSKCEMKKISPPMRSNWKVKINSLAMLIKAVAEGKVPQEALLANLVFLNGQARKLKDTLNYPGVTAWNDETPIVSRK